MRKHRNIIILALLVALAVVFVAGRAASCELMDGAAHAALSCPAGILPVPFVLGLMVLAVLPLLGLAPRTQLVRISIYRPPRQALAR